MNRIINGDVLRFAAHYKGERFHGVLCDPPYELGFMGRSWDSRGVSFRAETWRAIRSLLVPGAHLLAFGGTRTFHRIAVAIEDAGFEIRDTLGWLYGSGFPKSLNVSKAIESQITRGGSHTVLMRKTAMGDGYVRSDSYGKFRTGESRAMDNVRTTPPEFIPSTDAARAWQGYGTALKPAWEPVIVARNPIVGTVAQNAMEHGAGALNVDGGRVSTEEELRRVVCGWQTVYVGGSQKPVNTFDLHPEGISGRWPANILHDGSDEITEVMGDAQRFFYCAKASKRERDEGLSGFELRVAGVGDVDEASGRDSTKPGNQFGQGSRLRVEAGLSPTIPRANHHPTVKPLALTEYLATLILPPAHVESRLLVPFAGSGSECIGAIRAGWKHVVGIEQSDEYARIARARIEHHSR